MLIFSKMNASAFRYNIVIAIGAALLFVPFLGAVHLFDWDEINFAECAREMLVTHDYFSVKINYQAFWEKPPIFIWMQALSMSLFGIASHCSMRQYACIYMSKARCSATRRVERPA